MDFPRASQEALDLGLIIEIKAVPRGQIMRTTRQVRTKRKPRGPRGIVLRRCFGDLKSKFLLSKEKVTLRLNWNGKA